MPTREDVDLARAAIDRGFLTIKESIKCLEVQRDYENGGKIVPLEHILVEAGYLDQQQMGVLKESLAKSAALRHVGHYELLSRVGAGGMGTVYKAKDAKADRIVALKILSPAQASNKEFIQRFLREAHASGRLSHPNIVRGYDAGEANGQYYFAMEFVDGITVGEMLKEGRPVPEQQALDIAIQIAKALEHAESNSLVHRDIKPDNIMITKDGTAKLADLGLARLTTGESPAEQRSFGTAYYVSPEQCQGSEEVDSKSDMYSFGITLFHMLAGRVPFNDDSPEGIMARHLEEKRPYLKDLDVQISHGVSKIVRKLMAKNKRDRYANMSEVVRDLALVRMGRSPRLGERSQYDSNEYRYRSPTGSWRTRQPRLRDKLVVAAAAAVVGLAMLAAGYFLFELVRKTSDTTAVTNTKSEQETRPSGRPPHQIHLEDEVLARREGMPKQRFYQLLKSVGEKYPDTNSARRAAELIPAVLKEIEAEIEPVFKGFRDDALALCDQHQYKDALAKAGQFPVNKYAETRFPGRVESLKKEIMAHAETEYEKLAGQAAALTAEKKFDEAAALLRTIAESFGLPALAGRADAEIKQVEVARAAEQARLEEEARKLELEKQTQEAIRQQKLAIAATVNKAAQLATKTEYAAAAQTLRDAAVPLTDQAAQSSFTRAAGDLELLQKLFDSLRNAGHLLKGKTIAITRKNGSALQGTVFALRAEHISVEDSATATRSIRTVPWDDIAPEGLKKLLEMNAGDGLKFAEHYAVAALFCFSRQYDRARAEMEPFAQDPIEKGEVEARRADISFFAAQEQAEGGRP